MLTKEDLLRIASQYDLKRAGHSRETYLKRIIPLLERKEILILKGIRRCGKTTLMKQLIRHLIRSGVPDGDILYVNLDDFNFLPYLSIGLLEQILATRSAQRRQYLFLDEIQRVPQFESWLRTHYDRGTDIKFIISGSNSSLLAGELSTLLTGRNLTVEIFPLDYAEFKAFAGGTFDEYLSFGGFPEVVLEKNKGSKMALLQGYISDIIAKDILLRRVVRDKKQLLLFVQYLLRNPGVRLSINTLSKQTDLSKDTVKRYLGYMVDAYLVFEVPFFSHSAKSRFVPSNIPKYYLLDTGFYACTSPRVELGKLVENLVALHLHRAGKDVCYWRGRGEVDFVTEGLALNVTSGGRIAVRERQGLEEFLARHKNFRSLIVAESASKDIIPLEEFLLSAPQV